MNRRTMLLAAGSIIATTRSAFAHHGWSSFDEAKPIYLQGKVTSAQWRNPHVEVKLQGAGGAVPADLAQRKVPAQSAPVDAAKVLAAARAPSRATQVWTIEFAPLTRMEAWKIDEIKPGATIEVVGYTFAGEKGAAILRAEFLFVGGKAYGLRSSPA